MLTIQEIKNAKAGDKARKLYDRDGLYLFVTPAGGKLWRGKYRINGREKTFSLGPYPKVGLAEAREKWQDARKLDDPSAAKQAGKQAVDSSTPDLPRRRQRVAHAPDARLDAQARLAGLALPRYRHPADPGTPSDRRNPITRDHGRDRAHRGPRRRRDCDACPPARAGRVLLCCRPRIPRGQSGQRAPQSLEATQRRDSRPRLPPRSCRRSCTRSRPTTATPQPGWGCGC